MEDFESNFNHIFSFLFQNKAIEFELGSNYLNEKLTHRQADIGLLLLKYGEPILVGNELNLSPRTIQYHMKEIKEKFQKESMFKLPFELYNFYKRIYEKNFQ